MKFSILKQPNINKNKESGLRRLARELALRLLFQYDIGVNVSAEEILYLFTESFDPQKDQEQSLGITSKKFDKALPFAKILFFGVCQQITKIDQALTEIASNWQLSRMSNVDRNLLRLAYFEMFYLDDIPPKVSLNEAIELGKIYGTEDSGAFINGLLDRLLNELPEK